MSGSTQLGDRLREHPAIVIDPTDMHTEADLQLAFPELGAELDRATTHIMEFGVYIVFLVCHACIILAHRPADPTPGPEQTGSCRMADD
jgi:hypothetical protein